MSTIDLTARLRLAADYISVYGWTQGEIENVRGQVCLTGAVRNCAPQDGDEHVIREVLALRDRAERWNDAEIRTDFEVVGYLAAAEITDVDLADTFGPQWEHIVALVRTAATLTGEQANALVVASRAQRSVLPQFAWYEAWDAMQCPGVKKMLSAGMHATEYAGMNGRWTSLGRAQAAVRALVVRDLIGLHGLTQVHYDILSEPWRKTIGALHPDDAELDRT